MRAEEPKGIHTGIDERTDGLWSSSLYIQYVSEVQVRVWTKTITSLLYTDFVLVPPYLYSSAARSSFSQRLYVYHTLLIWCDARFLVQRLAWHAWLLQYHGARARAPSSTRTSVQHHQIKSQNQPLFPLKPLSSPFRSMGASHRRRSEGTSVIIWIGGPRLLFVAIRHISLQCVVRKVQ